MITLMKTEHKEVAESLFREMKDKFPGMACNYWGPTDGEYVVGVDVGPLTKVDKEVINKVTILRNSVEFFVKGFMAGYEAAIDFVQVKMK